MGIRLGFVAMVALSLLGCGGSGLPFVSQSAYTFPGGKGGQVIDPSFTAIETDAFRIIGTKNVIVTSLGIEFADPNQSARQVALYDSSGNVLATTTVTVTNTLIDGYFYRQITPITLTPGNQYYIGELHVEGTMDAYIWNTNVAMTPSYIQDIGTCYSGSSTISNGTSFTSPGTPRHYSASFRSHEAG